MASATKADTRGVIGSRRGTTKPIWCTTSGSTMGMERSRSVRPRVSASCLGMTLAQRPVRTWENNTIIELDGKVKLAHFIDGTSNTMIFTEKIAHCTNTVYQYGGTCWAYSQYGPGQAPLHPAFAVYWNGSSTGPQSKFQTQPDPAACDPTRASSPHPGGIQTLRADGNVRWLSSDVHPDIWWALCTRYGGEVIRDDF